MSTVPSDFNSADLYSPWPNFDPPADLPDDLQDIYRRASNLMLIAHGFCSHPDRFNYSLEQLSAWLGPLNQASDELTRWVVDHEAGLRGQAPEVLSALQGVLGVAQPLVMRLGGLLVLLDARAADSNDAQLVALVNALRESTTRNHTQYAHAALDGVSVSLDSLTELRSALSAWDQQRKSSKPDSTSNRVVTGQAEGTGESSNPRRTRGRKALSEAEIRKRRSLIDAWEQFRDSKTGQKKDFCEDRKIKVKQLNNALAWNRTRRNRLEK
jgi:hypothetical protein